MPVLVYSSITLHSFTALLRSLGGLEGQFPEAEAYSQSSFSLPLFPGMTIAQQDRVIHELKTQIEQS